MASSEAQSAERLNFRLAAEHKATIEQAAASLGQSVSDFAISTLVQTAQRVINDRDATLLSNRDRDLFLAAIDDPAARPNKALLKAAAWYKRQVK